MAIANREIKDRLFRMLFGSIEKKSNVISLYNALNGSNYPEDADIEIRTIDEIIWLGMKNDVSFIIDNRLSLWEQQSTWNPNMPVRGLMYFGKMYEAFIDGLEKRGLYSRQLIKLPMPRYAVFYCGVDKKVEPVTKLYLSDAFEIPDDSKEFEWTATVYDLKAPENAHLRKGCKALDDYVTFVNKLQEYVRTGMGYEKAIDETIDWCITHDVMKEFLQKSRAEVKDVCLTEYDEEKLKAVCHADGRAEGLAEGRAEGRTEMGHLYLLLEKDGRTGEFSKAIADKAYLEKLCKEYGI